MTWQELAEDFRELSAEERLEELIEQADRLPALSAERSSAPFPESCRVQECQTPVHLWVEVRQGKLHLEADVPRKSPTVRGLVTLVIELLEGADTVVVRDFPDDLAGELGLTGALGMTRQQGFRGVIRRIKQAVQAATGPA